MQKGVGRLTHWLRVNLPPGALEIPPAGPPMLQTVVGFSAGVSCERFPVVLTRVQEQGPRVRGSGTGWPARSVAPHGTLAQALASLLWGAALTAGSCLPHVRLLVWSLPADRRHPEATSPSGHADSHLGNEVKGQMGCDNEVSLSGAGSPRQPHPMYLSRTPEAQGGRGLPQVTGQRLHRPDRLTENFPLLSVSTGAVGVKPVCSGR